MGTPLTKSPRYSDFIKQRDVGLERVLGKYSAAISSILGVLKKRAEEIAAHAHITGTSKGQLKLSRDNFERSLSPYFELAIERTSALIRSLRKTTYIISTAGQAEAIGRALAKETKFEITRKDIHDASSRDMPFGGDMPLRVELAYHRLLRRVVDAYQLSQVMQSTPEETIERLGRAFPKGKYVKRKRSLMAKMTEAKRDRADRTKISTGIMDEDEWNDAVEDYLDKEIPLGRAPHDKIFYFEYDDSGDLIEEDSYFRYSWQVEQEMTDDFIDSVRNGENSAAKQNGISEFSWIAIIDAKTDDCCASRDGLTVTEIEDKLDSGEIDGDCDATSAPAHFNCRCRMAPVADDMPEETPPDLGGFDDWLEERKKSA